MKRYLAIVTAAAGLGLSASPADAHHSHPYFYDQCTSVTVEGRVESVQWIDPHTLIVVRTDDGAAYTVDWSPQSRLTYGGVIGAAKAALTSGARIAVTGNPVRTLAQIREHFPDYTREVNPNTIDPSRIRRVDDNWTWMRTPADKMPGAVAPGCADPTEQ